MKRIWKLDSKAKLLGYNKETKLSDNIEIDGSTKRWKIYAMSEEVQQVSEIRARWSSMQKLLETRYHL